MDTIELRQKSDQLRLNLINLIHSGKTGHTGGDLSVLNVLTVLYNRFLNVDPANPKMPERDRFVLSKGHCAEALYCVLCDKGFISKEELEQMMREVDKLIEDAKTETDRKNFKMALDQLNQIKNKHK